MQQLEHFMALLCLQQGFGKREYTRIMSAFSHFDLDRSSNLDTSEIIEILSYLNYAILPNDITSIQEEIGAEEGSKLNRQEFLVFMRKVREFEVMKVSECLAKSDAPTSKRELLQFVLRSLNYVADLDVIQEVAEEAGIRLTSATDRGSKGRATIHSSRGSRPTTPSVASGRFSVVGPAGSSASEPSRRVSVSLATTRLKSSFDDVQIATGSRGLDTARGTLRGAETKPVRRKSLRELRALPLPSTPARSRGSTKEAALAAEEEANSAPTLSEVWEFLEVFRAREGFTRVECNEIEAVFGQYLASADANGEISTLDAGRALQWLGYESPYEVLQQLVSQVDIDGSGRLSLPEFKKLVRKHRERQFKNVRAVLEEAGVNADKSLMSTQDWQAASMAMNFSMGKSPQGEGQLLFGKTLSMRSVGSSASGSPNRNVVQMMRTASKSLHRTSFVQSLGDKEATTHANLRFRFRQQDDDGDGKLTAEQLYNLCLSSYSDVYDSDLHAEMKRLVDEAVMEASDSFTFKDVQRIMQRFYDWKLKMKLVKEQQVVEGCSFTLTQVRGFRDVFNGIDTEASGFISFDALGNMLSRISPMNSRLAKQLAEVWVRMIPPSQVREGADFPDFLRLMEHLLEDNFADIKGKTAHYNLA
jgi:Ca2+-binding EF-hand superfamily protein